MEPIKVVLILTKIAYEKYEYNNSEIVAVSTDPDILKKIAMENTNVYDQQWQYTEQAEVLVMEEDEYGETYYAYEIHPMELLH